MEVVLGTDVASKISLEIGDVFYGTHGEAKNGHVHEDHPYKVVGILGRTNSVLDRLVLCNVESVWDVHSHSDKSHDDEDSHDHEAHEHDSEESHDHESHDHESHAHDAHDHDEHSGHNHDKHDHDHAHNHDHGDHDHSDYTPPEVIYEFDVDKQDPSSEITAVLMEFKTKMAMLNLPRHINNQTKLQAAIPSLEMNRLFYMIGVGATTIKFIAGGIMLMAGFSVFFVLLNRLRERQYELALMRSVGYHAKQIFMLLIYEGLALALIGYVLGWILSRVGIYFINLKSESDFNINFSWDFVQGEQWIFLLTLLIGIVASLIPGWRSMKMDVSTVLSQK